MLTSLRAVGELQNPAIRERHWDQLMRSTKVTFLVQTQFVYKLKIVYINSNVNIIICFFYGSRTENLWIVVMGLKILQ